MHPAPRTRVPKGAIVSELPIKDGKAQEEVRESLAHDAAPHEVIKRLASQEQPPSKKASVDLSTSPKATFLMRRTSAASNTGDRGHVRYDSPEVREHLKHLGPSNLASRPRTTRSTTVKIKTGLPAVDIPLKDVKAPPQNTLARNNTTDGGIGEGLLQSAGIDAKDGVHAVQIGYGSIERPKSSEAAGTNGEASQSGKDSLPKPPLQHRASASSARTTSTVGSLPRQEGRGSMAAIVTRSARSGSITENVVETGGIKKVILETTSSSSSDDGPNGKAGQADENEAPQGSRSSKKKKRKKRKKADHGESSPLLESHH